MQDPRIGLPSAIVERLNKDSFVLMRFDCVCDFCHQSLANTTDGVSWLKKEKDMCLKCFRDEKFLDLSQESQESQECLVCGGIPGESGHEVQKKVVCSVLGQLETCQIIPAEKSTNHKRKSPEKEEMESNGRKPGTADPAAMKQKRSKETKTSGSKEKSSPPSNPSKSERNRENRENRENRRTKLEEEEP